MLSLPDLATCKKIGFIVPSSNTAVEPISNAIIQSTGENVICIFTRIPVKTVGLDANSTAQFSIGTMVQAARLLADAQPDAILWNGTSGQWTGGTLEDEERLAKAMRHATGIPCSTTTLALVEGLIHLQVKKISIAVPYAEAHTAKVGEFFNACEFETIKTARLETTPPSNVHIANSGYDEIRDIIRQAAVPGCEAVLVSCTNWPATALAEKLEAELGVAVVDSISATAWWGLKMIGSTREVSGWGQLLRTGLR